MNEFAFIFVFFIAFALCVAALIIIRFRDRKNVLVSEQPDFFTHFYERKKAMLETSLPSLSICGYFILSAASPVVFGLILWFLFPNKTFVAFMSAFCVLIPEFIIRLIIESRKKRYEERYVRALKAFASALRSGMSIQQAVQDVAGNPFIADEIREGFRQIDSDIRVGISITEAFELFAQKADNNDARDVASAISMQSGIGGSEAKIIDTIALNIEDRMLMRKRIRAIFSSTEFMINTFDVLPFLILIFMYVCMPAYMEPILADPLSFALCILVLLFTLFGSYLIRKRLKQAKGE